MNNVNSEYSTTTDEKWMKLALEYAKKGIGHVAPNPLVGAILVKEGDCIGIGYHACYGEAHAEKRAFENAGKIDFSGSTLYVTLEPCCHFGKQPPCVDEIIKNKIKRVVIAMLDPNPLVSGKGVEKLRQAGIEITLGILENDARGINGPFIKTITTNKPYVLLKSAISLDGKLAASTGDSKWISSIESRTAVHALRHAYAAVMVGIGTVLSDNPSLDVRLCIPELKQMYGAVHQPYRIIVDSHARLPLDSKVLLHQDQKTIVAVLASAPESQKKALFNQGATLVECRELKGRVDLNHLMEQLIEKGINSILLEGGSTLHGEALKAGIVDEVCLYMAPIILGGNDTFQWSGKYSSPTIASAISLENLKVQMSGGDLCLQGLLKK